MQQAWRSLSTTRKRRKFALRNTRKLSPILNRSLNWARADSYAEARALAPDPYQPIR